MNPSELIAFISSCFSLSRQQEEQFVRLDTLYRDWNSRINVISRKDIDALYLHHVLHSLAIARYLQLKDLWDDFSHAAILDLGTGGGFPGIPLAILFPDASFVLCDSVGKKTLVAAGVSEALGLHNTQIVHARAESLERRFDYVVSRAVAALPDFYPWVKGRFTERILYLKGGDVAEEIALLMGRNHMQKGDVSVWDLHTWLQDPYFDGKLLIDIAAPKRQS